MASIRSFIAIDMPANIRDFAKERQRTLKNDGIDVKWVRSESIHLTLQFLGDVEKERIPAIHGSIQKAVKEISSFSLKVKGLGVFPNLKRPRVIWVGLAGQTDLLKDLNEHISEALVPIGFPKDKRDFTGHLTIGRVKGKIDRKKIEHALSAQKDYETPYFKVKSVVLFKSRLTPRGAVYTKLAEAPLNVLSE